MISGLLELATCVIEARVRSGLLAVREIQALHQLGLASLRGRDEHRQLLGRCLGLRRAHQQILLLALPVGCPCFQLAQTELQPLGRAACILRHVLDPAFQ